MKKQDKSLLLSTIDPNNTSVPGELFGLPFTEEHSEVIILPVPWEATVSYKAGTSSAPEAIRQASTQVDLLIPTIQDAWKLGIYMLPTPLHMMASAREARHKALESRALLDQGISAAYEARTAVNQASKRMCGYVKKTAQTYLNKNKCVGVVGGDHSVPLGLIQALAERHKSFGILHIDAHADLREAYEGFVYSHASIMHHVSHLSAVIRIVQVGIRDYCEEEQQVMKKKDKQIVLFDDEAIHDHMAKGSTWSSLCHEMIAHLPKEVYISFDVDGLEHSLCPNTGTPVPGGLTYYQATSLIKQIVSSGRLIIGFDLCEIGTGDNEWDANVGARLLYFLSNYMALSQKRLKLSSSI